MDHATTNLENINNNFLESIDSIMAHSWGASHLGLHFGKAKHSKVISPRIMWNPMDFGAAMDVYILGYSNYIF